MYRKGDVDKMKKIVMNTVFVLLLFAVSGCVTNTVEVVHRYEPGTKFTADGKEVVAELQAENYVTLLFGVFPILSGRPTRPNAMQYDMWENNARVVSVGNYVLMVVSTDCDAIVSDFKALVG